MRTTLHGAYGRLHGKKGKGGKGKGQRNDGNGMFGDRADRARASASRPSRTSRHGADEEEESQWSKFLKGKELREQELLAEAHHHEQQADQCRAQAEGLRRELQQMLDEADGR